MTGKPDDVRHLSRADYAKRKYLALRPDPPAPPPPPREPSPAMKMSDAEYRAALKAATANTPQKKDE
jgi:hypothetical protein